MQIFSIIMPLDRETLDMLDIEYLASAFTKGSEIRRKLFGDFT